MKKNFFIRVDGSSIIGTGHIIRCIALAEELKNSFKKIIFLTKQDSGILIDIIKKNGFDVIILDSKANFPKKNKNNYYNEINIIKNCLNYYENDLNYLLIDHYEIDTIYESKLRNTFRQIFVIDDLANRIHDCDLLIDQNLYENPTKRYVNLIPKNSITLLGPKFVILRSEFLTLESNKSKNFSVKKILISFGGSDPTNECQKILRAICSQKIKKFDITVVAGIHNQNFESLKKEFSKNENIKIFHHMENFSELLLQSDLCFGAGGTTTWERMYLGIPSIVTIISSDQKESVNFLAKLGHVINLGFAQNLSENDYLKCIENIDSIVLQNMSIKNQELIDGQGCKRIKKQIMALVSDDQ